jgi:hypothetical protein
MMHVLELDVGSSLVVWHDRIKPTEGLSSLIRLRRGRIRSMYRHK